LAGGSGDERGHIQSICGFDPGSTVKLLVRSPKGVWAFSLIELLVAVSVLTFFLLILFQMFNETARAWAAAERKVDSFREARAALFYISRDLRNIYSSTNAPMLIQGTGKIGTNLYFIASCPPEAQDSASRSDLCTVGYSVVYTVDASAGLSSYKLYRYFLSSSPTFTNILAGPLSLYVNPPPNPSLNSVYDEVMARNVFDMKIEAVGTNGVAWDFTPGITNSSLSLLKITLQAYNRTTAAKLAGPTDWGNTNAPLQRANLQEFSTAVAFP
jgi:hypothetical protein